MASQNLHEIFNNVAGSFTPIPPPLNLREDSKAPTFAVDLSKMLVIAPSYWKELKYSKELLGHETKHASADGLPYTYRNALRCEAETLKELGISVGTARMLLNVVYDAVVDLKVAKEGLDAKGMSEEWLQKFPVTKDTEGTSYHLLQVIYKDFFGTSLERTMYEDEVRLNSSYTKLKQTLMQLAVECEKYSEERNISKIVEAATMIRQLSRPDKLPTGSKSGNIGDVQFDRGDPNVRADAAEIGLEADLNNEQLAEFLGVDRGELEEVLEQAAEDKAREALWSKILGFKELFTTSSFYELKEPFIEKWKPYSRKVDPSSVIQNPHDPRRWRTTTLQTVTTIEQEGEAGGFSEVIIMLDQSGSTAGIFGERRILSYIKDTAYGLIAYAKHFKLPVAVVAFHSYAYLLSAKAKNYVEHGKKVFMLRPIGNTNLLDAVNLTLRMKPEKALIALITDGHVNENDLMYLANQNGVNRVIAAVVDASKEGVAAVKTTSDKIQVYVVKPEETGRTMVSALPSIRAS